TPYESEIYLIRPTAGEVLTEATTLVTFKGTGKETERLTLAVDGVTDGEVEFEVVDGIFKGELHLTTDLNGQEIEMTVRQYDGQDLINEDILTYYVALEDVVIDRFDFTDSVNDVTLKSNGTYPENESE